MDMMSYLMGRNSGSAKKGAKIEVVTELPETGEANVIYLVPKQDEDENNVFDEYIWINDDWELIGTTDIDLSNYYTKSEVDGKLPPIYVLNTTNQLNDNNGSQIFGNDEKTQLSNILTDSYAKGHKNIVIILCSTTSGKSYTFYSNGVISPPSYPFKFYSDYTPQNKDNMQKIYIRTFDVSGSWNDGVFTCTSMTYNFIRANLLTSDNNTAYNVSNDYTPAHKKYVDDNKGQTIQYETMPTASADYLGKIVQYTGTTDSNYTNGYFYVCVSDTENDVTTYGWDNIAVQSVSNIPNTLNVCIIDMNDTSSSSSWTSLIHSSTATSLTLNATIKTRIQSFLQEMYNQGNDYFAFLFTNNSSFGTYSILCYINKGWYKLSSKASYIEILSPVQENYYSISNQNSLSYSCVYRTRINLTWNGDTLTVSSSTLNCEGAIPFKKTPVYSLSGLSQYNSISGVYNTGDYVYYNELIYKCNSDNTSGPFDNSKWDEKTYMEYLSDTLVGGALNGSY